MEIELTQKELTKLRAHEPVTIKDISSRLKDNGSSIITVVLKKEE